MSVGWQGGWQGWHRSQKAPIVFAALLALLGSGNPSTAIAQSQVPKPDLTQNPKSKIQNPQIAQSPGSFCATDLPGQLDALLNAEPVPRSRWGVLVRSLDTGETLYAREADQFFTPASNAKVFTTAATLTALGPAFRIRTSLYRDASDRDAAEAAEAGQVRLRLVGRGDPTLTTAQLDALTTQLRAQGIARIDRLTVDTSYFQGDEVNPNWDWEDAQAGYGAPVSSVMVDGNAIALQLVPQALGQPLRVVWRDPADGAGWAIDNRSRTVAASEAEFTAVRRAFDRLLLRVGGQLRVGSAAELEIIPVTDPTRHFINRLRRSLRNQGIALGPVAIATGPTRLTEPEIASIASAPLSELLKPTNANSENLYAEAMLRILGAEQLPNQSANSLSAGITALKATLTQLGVSADSYAPVDGSGLARKNLASPESLVETLRAIARTPNARVFRDSLAVAGSSGTLQSRFRNTPVQGRLWGKTGAISGIASLSGYLEPPQHPPLVISILVNHFDQPVRTVRPTMDELVLRMARVQSCE
ncbi:D-alanyl-D-alanine carboxypeptidase/D-alanyl-D-alanine-endopeptidase [Thermoleptolyngbya sichuanensis XZ-Cy5]|uniref:D-alanyl-D-alanine carboxypeptidase/D-alanyl-D-alanine endopeptidase n=1 Tax=Thermoleptolyngbya sichuanensis TaxID=2885951 RepID=UPI00240D6021|nr:D-alanyl-D-alanine carboxypeptidase/D-alanyl-D-alanine-endopeptidase [Thermoleptolyngbya sichuanensis]MDG2616737.1 D-alanyl-D-alanine carboxypeptidase/D-alanyl-D-alanine-endopeptidase [Thermoleptolyngbya sichuanensis XZ-Cy5]